MRNKMVIEIKGDTSNLNDVITSGYFRIGDTCVKVRGIERDIVKSLNPSTQDVKHVVVDCSTDDILSQPQFHNGDTVYDENGVSYVYIGLHHKHDMTSVVYHLEAEEYIDVPNNELYSEKPVTPKDGEWWMCEIDHVNGIMSCVLKFTGNRWFTLYNEDDTLEYHGQQIKPLYRMIRDTNTDTE